MRESAETKYPRATIKYLRDLYIKLSKVTFCKHCFRKRSLLKFIYIKVLEEVPYLCQSNVSTL